MRHFIRQSRVMAPSFVHNFLVQLVLGYSYREPRTLSRWVFNALPGDLKVLRDEWKKLKHALVRSASGGNIFYHAAD